MNSPLPNPQSRLVQIYATASHWEAESACHRLREAGISARVVGQHLGPSLKSWQQNEANHGVMVLESEAKQAYDLLLQWLENGQLKTASDSATSSTTLTAPSAPARNQRREEWDVPSEDDTHQEPRTAVLMGNWLSKLMGVAGLCVLVLGCWTAWTNGRLLDRYSGEATAQVVALEEQLEVRRQERTFPPPEGWPTAYRYQVEGQNYRLVRMLEEDFPHQIALRYDPTDPSKLGPEHIVPPLWCLFLGSFVGGFLMLASWQFLRAAH